MIQIKRGSHFLTQDGSRKENTTGLCFASRHNRPPHPSSSAYPFMFSVRFGGNGGNLGFCGGSIKLAAAVVDEAHGVYGTATWAFSPGSGGGFGAVSNGEAAVLL